MINNLSDPWQHALDPTAAATQTPSSLVTFEFSLHFFMTYVASTADTTTVTSSASRLELRCRSVTKRGKAEDILVFVLGDTTMPVQEMTGPQMWNELLWPCFCCHGNLYPELSATHGQSWAATSFVMGFSVHLSQNGLSSENMLHSCIFQTGIRQERLGCDSTNWHDWVLFPCCTFSYDHKGAIKIPIYQFFLFNISGSFIHTGPNEKKIN